MKSSVSGSWIMHGINKGRNKEMNQMHGARGQIQGRPACAYAGMLPCNCAAHTAVFQNLATGKRKAEVIGANWLVRLLILIM